MVRDKKRKVRNEPLNLNALEQGASVCLRKWTENTEESNEKTEADEIPRVAQAEEGHQGSGCTASVVRGGADLEGGQTASTEVEHTLTVHIHTDQEAQQRKGVVLCRRGPLSFCLRVRTTCSDGGEKH